MYKCWTMAMTVKILGLNCEKIANNDKYLSNILNAYAFIY